VLPRNGDDRDLAGEVAGPAVLRVVHLRGHRPAALRALFGPRH
jgi:hypothetical protein